MKKYALPNSLMALGIFSLAVLSHSTALADSFAQRGDIINLPDALKNRLVKLAERPATYEPMRAFAEAESPSQLFEYYLLDTKGFQPNVFTTVIPKINSGVIPTAANAANRGLPTLGSVRVALEPKPGLPTDPNDPGAFIDIWTDISGLFVINNESGWYEGWMIHDLIVPAVARPRPDGSGAQFGTITPDDAKVLASMGSGHNLPGRGRIFTVDGLDSVCSKPTAILIGSSMNTRTGCIPYTNCLSPEAFRAPLPPGDNMVFSRSFPETGRRGGRTTISVFMAITQTTLVILIVCRQPASLIWIFPSRLMRSMQRSACVSFQAVWPMKSCWTSMYGLRLSNRALPISTNAFSMLTQPKSPA